MSGNIRNLVIGTIVIVLIAAGAAIALSGGDDEDAGGEVSSTTLVAGDNTADANGGGDSTGGGSGGDSTGGGSGGGSSQGGQEQGGNGGGGGGAGGGATTTTSTTAVQTAPTVSLIDQHCNAGKLLVTVTASASNAYRKGVKSVVTSRKNDENADLTFNAQWLGPETGSGNQWTATLVYANNYGKTLKVVATSDSNQTTTKEYSITVPC